MKKLKKIGIIFIFLFAFIILTNNMSNASSDNLYLNNLHFDVQINKDGSMNVTENWDIEIEGTNTLFKTFKTDSSKYSGIRDVTVTDVTVGTNKPFTEINELMYHVTKDCYYGMENDDGDFEIAWGVGLDNSFGTRKYKISYTVEDTISKYSDYAELYWQFVGKDFAIDSRKVTGTITFPESTNIKDEIKAWGHTEDLNGEIYVTGLNEITFEVNNFNSGRYIEIRTLFPTEMISYSSRTENMPILENVIAEETKWANETNARRARRDFIRALLLIVLNVILLITSAFFVKNIIKKIKAIKTSKKLKPTQEITYYREIPRENATPAEALYIYKNAKIVFPSAQLGAIFSATMLDLSLKKIIAFDVIKDKKEKVTIKILDETAIKLLESQDEREIANFLLSAVKSKKSNEITVKDLQKYIQKSSTKIVALQEKIEKGTKLGLERNQITDKEEIKKYTKSVSSRVSYIMALVIGTISIMGTFAVFEDINKYVLIGYIPFFITSIINIILSSIEISRINVYTQKGVDETEKWKGLKKYMEDFSLLKEREVPEIAIWEKFLVYATVFGIADKVLKQLKIVYPDIENSIDMDTYSCMYLMTHTNFSSSFSNAISSSISASYSSGSGRRWWILWRRWRWPVAGGGGGGR